MIDPNTGGRPARAIFGIVSGVLLFAFTCAASRAGDWPQVGYDAAHASCSPDPLPARLRLHWTLALPALRPTWPDQTRVRSDCVYHPIVLGRHLIVTSSGEDSVAAYDLADGREAWRFFTGGPIRVAPAGQVARQGEGEGNGAARRVFVGSDDGFLYALDADRGTLLWKFKGAPRTRRVLGNGRLIDTWAVRGGPVVTREAAGDRVYFAAGVWPFMGCFVHCLDAATGRVVWTNSGEGADFLVQPHGSPSFSGIAPQGTLAVVGDQLLVPNGRSVPAVFDRRTGKMLAFELANKFGGDAVVAAHGPEGDFFFTGEMAFSATSGKALAEAPAAPALVGTQGYAAVADGIATFDAAALARPPRSRFAGPGKVTRAVSYAVDGSRAVVAAGGRLYAGGKDSTGQGYVAAFDLPLDVEADDPAWRVEVPGTVAALVPAGGRLLAVTEEGQIHCLGEDAGDGPAAGTSAGANGETSDVVAPWHGRPARDSSRDDGALRTTGILPVPTAPPFPAAWPLGVALEHQSQCLSHPAVVAGLAHGQDALGTIVPFAGGEVTSADATPLAAAPEGDWAVVLGADREALARRLAERARLHVVLLEPDADRAGALRRRLQGDGLYGTAVAVVVGDWRSAALPPYFASLLVGGPAGPAGSIGSASLDPSDPAACEAAYRVLHPYRGRAFLATDEPGRRTLAEWAAARHAGHATVVEHGESAGGWTELARVGGLPGAGQWTHEHADAANTRVSPDLLVKAPLGVLWFGGSSNDGMLPRHGHGPQPQVIDGRLFIEGVDCLRAMDIYTGRVLWEAQLPGVGSFYNNTSHQAGANGGGSNFVSTHDGIYLVRGRACARLDPATGRTLGEFALPAPFAGDGDATWGYLNVEGDYLIGGVGSRAKAGASPLAAPVKHDPDEDPAKAGFRPVVTNPRPIGSRALFVLDRHSGRLLWTATAAREFRHNAICAGGGRLYAIDPFTVAPGARPTRTADATGGGAGAGNGTGDSTFGGTLGGMSERAVLASAAGGLGLIPTREPTGTLSVFDLASGRPLWSAADNVFGTWLSYSAEFDVLVECGRRNRDTLRDESRGMRAYQADTGRALWLDPLALGPAILHGRTILKEGGAADLLSGAPVIAVDPLTGKSAPWAWTRLYGCNTPAASENLLVFRSGAAGYYDLARRGGTGNFGGFRSSCTNNLVVAGGVLCAPDYTRTCTCSYQMQTSLALVPDAEVEEWTYQGTAGEVAGPVRRLGINFGAPGNRVDEAGTLWLEYPTAGGKSPRPKVLVNFAGSAGEGRKVNYFRRHASAVSGPMPWVTASGAADLRSLWVGLNGDDDRPGAYTVRLYFAQPPTAVVKPCLFDVAIEGGVVERGLDVAKAAGGADRSLIREYHGVRAGEGLFVELKPAGPKESKHAAAGVPILCGIEIVAECGS